jgi:hypothetical protein
MGNLNAAKARSDLKPIRVCPPLPSGGLINPNNRVASGVTRSTFTRAIAQPFGLDPQIGRNGYRIGNGGRRHELTPVVEPPGR